MAAPVGKVASGLGSPVLLGGAARGAPALLRVQSFLDYLDARMAAPGDTREEVVRKGLAARIALLGCPLAAFSAINATMPLDGNEGSMFAGSMCMGILISCLAVLAWLLVVRTLPGLVVGAWSGSSAFCILCSDFATFGRFDAWSLVILVMDGVLICQAPRSVGVVVLALTILWLFLRSAEEAMAFGLYEVVPTPGIYSTYECPPVGKWNFGTLLGVRCFVLFADFMVTRGFADSLRAKNELLADSIDVAEDVGTLLAEYETDAARELLEGGAGASLPPRLRHALRELVSNLTSYKPYLPQSCLPGYCDDDVVVATFRTGRSTARASSPRGSWAGNRSPPAAGRGSPARKRALSSASSASEPSGRANASGGLNRDASMSNVRGMLNASMSNTVLSRPQPQITRELTASQLRNSPSREWATAAYNPREGAAVAPSPHSVARESLAGPGAQPRRAAAQALARRRVTLVHVNLRGYLAAARAAPPARLHEFHAVVLARMLASAVNHRGLSEGVSADRFTASVNAARAAAGHSLAGMRIAWEVGTGVGAATVLGESAVPPASAVCSGAVLCGSIGCDGLMRYAFIGYAGAWVYVLERLASAWRAAVAANGAAKGDADAQFEFRLRDAARLRKASHAGAKPQLLWQAEAPRQTGGGDEWMYEMERMWEQDRWRHVNAAKAALLQGDYDAALRCAAEAGVPPADGSGSVSLLSAGAAADRSPGTEVCPDGDAADPAAQLAEVAALARERPADPCAVLREAVLTHGPLPPS